MSIQQAIAVPAFRDQLNLARDKSCWFEAIATAIFTVWFFSTALKALWSVPLWYDEFFTLALARMNVIQIWNTLQQGLEPNPPIGYLLSALAYHCSGGLDWTIRLPSVLALWSAAFLMYRMVRPYTETVVAVSMMFLTPVLFGTLNFLDARPYALLLLCAVITIRFWMKFRRGDLISRFGLAVSISAALWVHFAGLALVISLAAAEVVRSWRLKEVRRDVWGALLVAGCTIIPLIRQIQEFSAMFHSWLTGAVIFWATPSIWVAILVYFRFCILLLPSSAILLLARIQVPQGGPDCAYEDVCSIAMLASTPIMAYGIAIVSKSAFLPRYCVTAIPGALILCSLMLGRARGRPDYVMRTLTILTLPLYCVLVSTTLFRLPDSHVRDCLKQIEALSNRNLPVAIADAGIFPAAVHYAGPGLKPRLLYLASSVDAKKLVDFVPEMGLTVLRQWYNFPIQDFRSFLKQKRPFLLLVAGGKDIEWLPRRVGEITSIRVQTITKTGNVSILLCSFDGDSR